MSDALFKADWFLPWTNPVADGRLAPCAPHHFAASEFAPATTAGIADVFQECMPYE